VDELTDEFEVIGTIIRDDSMECKIKKGKYWNIEVLDIRWFKDNKPTNKGVRLNMEEAKLLLQILGREIE
jgi:hypothetical protein|tara:strand:+ start:948 stop:1157 length:210 start_codon:yes stop_codon:yes gene_type:complete